MRESPLLARVNEADAAASHALPDRDKLSILAVSGSAVVVSRTSEKLSSADDVGRIREGANPTLSPSASLPSHPPPLASLLLRRLRRATACTYQSHTLCGGVDDASGAQEFRHGHFQHGSYGRSAGANVSRIWGLEGKDPQNFRSGLSKDSAKWWL